MTAGRRAGSLAVAVMALALSGRAARAAACAGPREAAAATLPGGTDAADYGTIPEACPATDVGLRLRATALVASEKPDYFGNIAATGTLRLRQVVGRSGRTWLSLAADLLTYRYVANAVVVSDGFAFGPPTLGLHRALGGGERVAATIYGRALLPLDTARVNGVRTGLELGGTLRVPFGASGRGGLEGGLGFLGPLVVVAGQTHASLESVGLVQGWFSVRPRLAVFAGAAVRGELAPDATLRTVAPRFAARAITRGGVSFAVLAELPSAGVDRTDAIVAFFLGWEAPPAAAAPAPPPL